jgi:hypothetical protein
MKFLVAGYLASKAFLKTHTTTITDPASERRLSRVVRRHRSEDQALRLPARSIAAQREDVLQPLYEPSVYLSPVLDEIE